MSNRSFVCWTCRAVRRAEAQYSAARDVVCARCGERMEKLGWRARVPSRDDDRAWAELRELQRAGKL